MLESRRKKKQTQRKEAETVIANENRCNVLMKGDEFNRGTDKKEITSKNDAGTQRSINSRRHKRKEKK